MQDRFPSTLIWIGGAAVVCSIAAELFGLGRAGFGRGQLLLVAGGLAAMGLGAWLHPAVTWARLRGDAERRLPASRLLSVAVSFGLLGGLAEDLMVPVRTHLLDRGLSINPHVFWMAPTANALVFAGLGVLLLLLARVVPRVATPAGAAGACALLATLAVLWMVPGLLASAAIVVAVAVGWQVGNVAGRRPRGLTTAVRWALPCLAALVGAIGVGTWAWFAWPERTALAALPAAPSGVPNVLLVVLDTVRAKNLGLYGYDRPTSPRLEHLAEHGVTFDHVLSTSPWTLPSHGTMFTGRWPHELFPSDTTPLNAGTAMSDEHVTLAELLSARGYLTAGFAANLHYCSRAHGLNRGFAHYEAYRASLEWFAESPSIGHQVGREIRGALGDERRVGRRTAGEINDAFLTWLDGRGAESARPFFAFLNYFDAHDPYLPEPEFATAFDASPQQAVRWGTSDPAELDGLQRAYDACVAYLDSRIGAVVDALGERGLLENTVVIVTADHGEQFGDHGLNGHTNSLYRELLEVPLVVVWPSRLPAGVRVATPVSLADLPATILELTGTAGDATLPGTSLSRFWRTGSADAGSGDALFAEIVIGGPPPAVWGREMQGLRGMQALFAGGYQYIRSVGSPEREELYRFDSDPAAAHDLTGTKAAQPVLEQLRAQVAQHAGPR